MGSLAHSKALAQPYKVGSQETQEIALRSWERKEIHEDKKQEENNPQPRCRGAPVLFTSGQCKPY